MPFCNLLRRYSLNIKQHIHFETIDSTNTYARQNAENLSTPSLITADCQTAGRGRTGKSFYSPAGSGIYFTLLFEADKNFDLITPAAAVCVCRAIKKFTGKDAKIKWVNDIFLDGKKVCGILTERFKAKDKELTATGIGVNITTSDFPDDLQNAGSLGLDFNHIEFAKFTAGMLLEINKNFERTSVITEYRAGLFIIGKEIEFLQNGKIIKGTAVDINDSCNLITKTSEGLVTLSSGEVSIIMR